MLEVKDLRKAVPKGPVLLNGVCFKVSKGEFVGVLGPSGAGKSLSIRCVLGLTQADCGEVLFEDSKGHCCNMVQLRGRALREARMKMGVIFQGSNLVKRLTVLENVMLGRLARIPAWRSWLYGFTDKEAQQALEALDRIDMADYAARLTGTLSGGEMQRVAIARAINQSPTLYIADEPVSSLDPKNARAIMKMLAPLAKDKAVLGVFHQPELVAKYCTRMVGLRDGKVIYDGAPSRDEKLLRKIYGEELDEVADTAGRVESARSREVVNVAKVF